MFSFKNFDFHFEVVVAHHCLRLWPFVFTIAFTSISFIYIYDFINCFTKYFNVEWRLIVLCIIWNFFSLLILCFWYFVCFLNLCFSCMPHSAHALTHTFLGCIYCSVTIAKIKIHQTMQLLLNARHAIRAQTFCTWSTSRVLVNISLFSKAIIQLCIASFGGFSLSLTTYFWVYAPLLFRKNAFWCVIFFLSFYNALFFVRIQLLCLIRCK